MAKIAYEDVVNGETILRTPTMAAGTAAAFLKNKVGRPFWWWPSVPAGTIVGCEFNGAPIATNNTQQNQALIDAITTPPEEVLVYA